MIINSNFQMNHRSIEEFARVMVPEALDKNLDIEIERESRDIVVRLEIDGRVEFFRYPDQNGKFEDQEITMTKILMLKFFGKKYSWGGLMGVRPTKVVRRLLALGYGYEEIKKIMEEFLLVSREKIELLIEVVKKELEFLDRKHINLYIGIPFCPTKCKYCSFASYEIGSGVGRYYNDFVKTLLDEIELTGKFLREENFKISSLYIGGGTPSTLIEKDLEDVLKAVNTHIDMSDVREFTFEAGREDTLTDEKLEIAKKYGVDRISLNPQTFKVETLRKVNRKFDRENFEKYFKKAKELGFIDSILFENEFAQNQINIAQKNIVNSTNCMIDESLINQMQENKQSILNNQHSADFFNAQKRKMLARLNLLNLGGKVDE